MIADPKTVSDAKFIIGSLASHPTGWMREDEMIFIFEQAGRGVGDEFKAALDYAKAAGWIGGMRGGGLLHISPQGRQIAAREAK